MSSRSFIIAQVLVTTPICYYLDAAITCFLVAEGIRHLYASHRTNVDLDGLCRNLCPTVVLNRAKFTVSNCRGVELLRLAIVVLGQTTHNCVEQEKNARQGTTIPEAPADSPTGTNTAW